MKCKLLLALLFICSKFILAQEKVELTGQIKDAQTKSALEFCSVAVYNSKDSLITGGVSDNKGFFTIPLARGNYNFVISFIGYKKDTIKSRDVMENTFLGIIKLEQDSKFLNEVTIKANSSENQLDRDIQIVTDKLKSGTSSAKEVLEKVNGVTYDRYSNKIKVDNNDKVIILVDGMEKDQEYIKNLAPDRLKKIEVIRDPGGRYGLEGYSAVINIILKKDYKGTEILVSDRPMVDVDAVKKDYMLVQNNANASVNYVYNKINLYATYGINYNNFNLPSTSTKEYSDGYTITKSPSDSKDMNTKVNEVYNNYTLGADYYINPKHTLSFESDLSTQPWGRNTTKENYDVALTKGGVFLSGYKSESSSTSGNYTSNNSLFYDGKLDEKNLLNANFTYSLYNNKYLNTYKDDLLNHTNENGTDTKNSTKFYVEYTHIFKNKTNLQIGYGNTWEQLNNNFKTDTVSNLFSYADIRHKLYAYYSWQKNKKFSVKIGGAGETSSPNANGVRNNYLTFQPYGDIKYTPSESFDIKLKYRAGTTYPNISETNPFTSIIDPQSVKTGNPYLKPELTHKISLQTDILGGLLTLEPYYHFSDNYITESGTLRSDSVFVYSYNNMGKYRKYGAEARFTIPIGKVFFLQSAFDFFNNKIQYSGKTNEFNDWTMFSQLIYQNQKTSTVAGLKYQKNLYKDITAQGYNKYDNDFWIAFVQQPFFKQKLNVILLYFLPVSAGVDFKQGSYVKTDTYKESKYGDIGFLKNMFMLEISYRFNKGKSANKTEKNMEQDNEKNKKGVF